MAVVINSCRQTELASDDQIDCSTDCRAALMAYEYAPCASWAVRADNRSIQGFDGLDSWGLELPFQHGAANQNVAVGGIDTVDFADCVRLNTRHEY